MSCLHLELFGKPQITHGDRSVSFRTRKALALLIYLAVEGGAHARAKLVTVFWPESDSAAGRATLRSTLRYLRNPLEHATDDVVPHLTATRDALSFNFDAPYALDLDRVAAALEVERDGQQAADLLQEAITVQRGYFLEGFSLPDAPAFEAWARFQREHWHLRLAEIFARLAEIQARAGATTAAVETTMRWVRFQPLREVAYRHLMRLQLAEGDRTAALQTYESCRQTLAQELGVKPDPETRALAARIEARLSPPQSEPTTSSFEAGVGGLAQAQELQAESAFPFVGRGEEHTRLAEAYYCTEGGQPQVAVVRGEAGIGKTRLAQEFLNWAAAEGAQVLRGRAFETGGRLPYQPVVDALRPLAPHMPDLLASTWLGELARILPELGEIVADIPSPTADKKLGRSHLFEAVARLGRAVAGRAPLVIFLDDLQWADASTLDLLAYAARRWQEQKSPILLLATVRAEALHRAVASAALRDWLRDLERRPGLLRLRIQRLEQSEVDQFVARTLLADAGEEQLDRFSRWLYRETSGQPFYLTETVKALLENQVMVPQQAEPGRTALTFSPQVTASVSWAEGDPLDGFIPPGIRDVVRERLARLSDTAFDLLVAAAVLGQAFAFEELCRVADLERSQVLVDMDHLLGLRLLAEAGRRNRPYTFAHDKVRDVVYTEAGDARRRLFHERACRMLEETGAAPAQAAHHALAAGLDRAAFRHALIAGDNARELFAIRDAVAHYETARTLLRENLQLKTNVALAKIHHLYRHLARSYELLDDWQAAEATAEEMLAVAGDLGAAPVQVTALNRLAAIAIQSRLEAKEAARLLQKAAVVAEAHDDEVGLAETEWSLAQTCFHRRDRAGTIAHGERALALAQALDRPALAARSHNILSYAKTGPATLSHLAEARAHATAGRELYAEQGNRAMEVDCRNMLGSIALHSGRLADAEEHLRQAWAKSVEIDNLWGQANTGFNLAQLLIETGRYGQALTQIDESVQAAEAGNPTPLAAGTLSVRGGVYRALLALDQALADHLEADRIFAAAPNPHVAHVMAADLCADYALTGDWEQAYEYARRAIQHDRSDAWLFSGFQEWLLVAALLRGGDERLARQATEQFGNLVGENPRYQIPYRRALALLANKAGDLVQARAHLEAALNRANEIELPGEQWQLLTAQAQLAEKRGNEGRAVSLQRQASAVVQSIANTLENPELEQIFLEKAAGYLPFL